MLKLCLGSTKSSWLEAPQSPFPRSGPGRGLLKSHTPLRGGPQALVALSPPGRAREDNVNAQQDQLARRIARHVVALAGGMGP